MRCFDLRDNGKPLVCGLLTDPVFLDNTSDLGPGPDALGDAIACSARRLLDCHMPAAGDREGDPVKGGGMRDAQQWLKPFWEWSARTAPDRLALTCHAWVSLS